jgi:hypothetical protein
MLMDTTELMMKVRRLRAATGDSEELDLSKFPPSFVQTESGIQLRSDFSGGFSQEQLENIAFGIIRAISDLYDHLRKWARANGRDEKAVDETIRGSRELQLIMDLATLDKHGGHDRSGGRSGARPRLVNVKRVFEMTTRAREGSFIGFSVTPEGIRTFGDGKAAVVVSGEVVDDNGKSLVLSYVQQRAIQHWEELMARWGIILPPDA